MYAAGHGSAITMSRYVAHGDTYWEHVVSAWCPRASAGHWMAKPGAACAATWARAAVHP
jgi:hypothetical protein